MTTVTFRKLDTDTAAPTYAVLLDGVRIGRLEAPYRELGEREWRGYVDGITSAVTTTETSRKAAAAVLVRRHAAA